MVSYAQRIARRIETHLALDSPFRKRLHRGKRLWDAADQFRANSGLKAKEYSGPTGDNKPPGAWLQPRVSR